MESKLQTPENGVTIRMYRTGHGDCFLLAMPREGGGDPIYVLIDCGLKPGSQRFIHGKNIGTIVDHIGEATGYHLDLVIITHEHQDHVNGFWKKKNPYFGDITIEQAWLAWTEDPLDDLANTLRQRHRDQLLELVEARNQLALSIGEEDEAIGRLDGFISLEFGGEDDQFDLATLRAAAKDPRRSRNKQSMKLIKEKASERKGVRYLSPGGDPIAVEDSAGIQAFVLGPPRDEDLLRDEDPRGDEGFLGHLSESHGLSFAAAAQTEAKERTSPFAERYRVPLNRAFQRPFFRNHYGKGERGEDDTDKIEVPTNAPWRRIDSEWLFAAENLALKLNAGINNTSLVLAFELPQTKKVLLFVGDAQRGSWITWDDHRWQGDKGPIDARDLLARTVLYKVGHHGSHNATLSGQTDANYPNLSWMATSPYKEEFVAMITAVNRWALEKNSPPWRHPLPSIKRALEAKAQGRVFQTDIDELEKPDSVDDAGWDAFLQRSTFEELYFDLVVLDE